MITLRKFFALAVIGSSIIFASCSKSSSDNNIVTGKSLVMTPAQESPVVTNSTATGTLSYSFDKTTKVFTYTLNWNGLSDSLTASHIHGTAPRGVSTGVKIGFSNLPKGFSGTYSSSTQVDGVLIKEDSLLNGFYYFNIHTKKNPGGEIRGQIEF